jgi:hypothetical protein
MMKTDDLKSKYQKDGILFPLDGLSKEEIKEAQEQYLALCEASKVVLEGKQRLFGHLHYPWVAKLASHPAILDKVECLIGPNILVWVSEFNAKAPNTPHYFSWHQDLYYWGYQRKENITMTPVVTVWLSLFFANAENGCMRVIPGSHDQLVTHNENVNEYNMLTRGQEVDVEIDEQQAIYIELAPGEFSIHHPLIYHASSANKSSHTRVGLVLRYLSPEIIPPKRPAYGWLVRGEDPKGNWDHIHPADIANHQAANELKEKCIDSVQSFTGARFK